MLPPIQVQGALDVHEKTVAGAFLDVYQDRLAHVLHRLEQFDSVLQAVISA